MKKSGFFIIALLLINIKLFASFDFNDNCKNAYIAVSRLNFDLAKVNVNGGAIALGHPIGASGARILTTLLYEMKRTDAKTGLATLCIGGGQGTSIIIEKI